MSASLPASPNVSVIMPVFNERATVEAVLQLVLAQPCVAEVVVVDDCSTDGTFEVLTNAAATEQRIRLHRHDRNQGNQFLTLISNMTTNLNLTDMEACYKVFKRELIQSVNLEENRFGIEPEIVAKIARTGARIYEVAISYHGRTYAEGKKIGWKDGLSALRCILKYGLLR